MTMLLPLLEHAKPSNIIATEFTLLWLNCIACLHLGNFTLGLWFDWSQQCTISRSYMDQAAIKCNIKWVEAIALKLASGTVAASLIRANIICRFGITKRLLSDNSTPFVNMHLWESHDSYRLIMWSRALIVIKETVKQRPPLTHCFEFLAEWFIKNLRDGLVFHFLALWAYRTPRRTSTHVTPFFLFYGAKAVVSIKVMVLSV